LRFVPVAVVVAPAASFAALDGAFSLSLFVERPPRDCG
jgi:hypothetical protein